MNDKRICGGPTLGLEDPLHCVRLQGIGSEAVDRLGGKRHQASTAQDSGGLRDHGGTRINRVHGQNQSGHTVL